MLDRPYSHTLQFLNRSRYGLLAQDLYTSEEKLDLPTFPIQCLSFTSSLDATSHTFDPLVFLLRKFFWFLLDRLLYRLTFLAASKGPPDFIR